MNATLPAGALNAGAVIKVFDKEFDEELRARHRVHHHEAYDDLALKGISVTSLVATEAFPGKGWDQVAERSYRATAKAWASRVKTRSKRVETYLEAVADAMLKYCTWLTPPADQ